VAATKLDIAQGKARKNSAVATNDSAVGAEGDTMKASAASHREAGASCCSEDATTHSADSEGSRGKASEVLKYLNTVPDKEVYPSARCNFNGMPRYMYQRTASSSSESTNRANQATRARTAVDVVSSSRLLLQLAASRYQLGCLIPKESSGFLCFPFMWRFFHRNYNSCSARIFSEPPRKSCLYVAYVGCYEGNEFVKKT